MQRPQHRDVRGNRFVESQDVALDKPHDDGRRRDLRHREPWHGALGGHRHLTSEIGHADGSSRPNALGTDDDQRDTGCRRADRAREPGVDVFLCWHGNLLTGSAEPSF
jgi:hypothetical protein